MSLFIKRPSFLKFTHCDNLVKLDQISSFLNCCFVTTRIFISRVITRMQLVVVAVKTADRRLCEQISNLFDNVKLGNIMVRLVGYIGLRLG